MTIDPSTVNLLVQFQGPALFLGAFFFGETVIITAAFLAAQGLWSMPAVFGLALAGTLASDAAWYFLGRNAYFHLRKKQSHREKQERILAFLEQFAGNNLWLLMLCIKFAYGTRILTIIYLSMRRMRFRMFIAFDTVSTLIWLPVMCAIGWLAGKSLTNLMPFLNTFEYATALLISILVLFKLGSVWISRKITRKPQR